MWKAVFVGKHSTCILAPLCKKYNVVDYVYLLSAWKDDKAFFNSEAHILEGKKEDKEKFIKALKKQKNIIKLEQRGNFIITLDKRPLWMAAYMPLWDKQIIQTKPIIQKTDGTEIWEMASWNKEPLIHILERLPKEFQIKLMSIKKTKLDEIFLPQIMPKITDRQKEVLEFAIQKGYYDFPRKTNLDKLAKALNVKKPTIQQHLRIAEKKLIPSLIKNIY